MNNFFIPVKNMYFKSIWYTFVEQSSLAEMKNSLTAESRLLQAQIGQQDRVAMSITDRMYSEAQELLQLFGVPYIVSPMEAEAQCAQLDLSNLTQGTITDDSDIWLFGGSRVYKNFFNQDRYVEHFNKAAIESQLCKG